MGRILSIDYGTRRTGIAVTDPAQIIANGLTTIPTAQLMDFLSQYLVREQVDKVIIGMPKEMTGKPSENARHIAVFKKKFVQKFPNVPLEDYDERFTSVLAHMSMQQGGLSKTARQNKALVDEISATIILQSYMEYTRHRHC